MPLLLLLLTFLRTPLTFAVRWLLILLLYAALRLRVVLLQPGQVLLVCLLECVVLSCLAMA